MANISTTVEKFFEKLADEVKSLQVSGKSAEEIKESLKDKYEEPDINVALAKAGIGIEHKKKFFQKKEKPKAQTTEGKKKEVGMKTIGLIAAIIVLLLLIIVVFFFL